MCSQRSQPPIIQVVYLFYLAAACAQDFLTGCLAVLDSFRILYLVHLRPRGSQHFSPSPGSRALHSVHLRASRYCISFRLQGLELSLQYIYAPSGTQYFFSIPGSPALLSVHLRTSRYSAFFSTYRVSFSIAPRHSSGVREDTSQQSTRIVSTPSFL